MIKATLNHTSQIIRTSQKSHTSQVVDILKTDCVFETVDTFNTDCVLKSVGSLKAGNSQRRMIFHRPRIKLLFVLLIATIVILFSPKVFLPPLVAADFYWENPLTVTKSDTRFPAAASAPENASRHVSIVTWQEIVTSDNQKGSIYLSSYISDNGSPWKLNSRFIGPFPYSGEVPNIHSVAVNDKGVIAIAVLSDTQTISIYTSIDAGASFSLYKFPVAASPLVAPRIYRTSSGGFTIFATQGLNEAFSLLYAQSQDGLSWTPFDFFEPARTQINPFVPMLCAFPTASGGTTDIVVFQASHNSGTRLSYQLYSTKSSDGGKTWSPSVLITDKDIPSSSYSSTVFTNYLNQRPYVYVYKNAPYLAWERTYYSSENAQIYVAQLSTDGRIAGIPDQITSSGDGKQPVLFSSDETLSLLWFDTRRGVETVYMAQRNGIYWDEERISKVNRASLFSLPVLVPSQLFPGQTDLHIFWQQAQSDGTGRITCLSPDRSVALSSFNPLSYTRGKRSTSSKVSIRVILPTDSTGIEGYSWIWTQDQNAEPPETSMRLASQTDLSVNADADGLWYLKVKAYDYAGNWSDSSSISYFRDTTPPVSPLIAMIPLDSYGFGQSNTIPLSWQPGYLNVPEPDIALVETDENGAEVGKGITESVNTVEKTDENGADTESVIKETNSAKANENSAETESIAKETLAITPEIDDDIAGYTWSLEYLSTIPSNLVHTQKRPMTVSEDIAVSELNKLLATNKKPSRPPSRIVGKNLSTRYSNRENGLYAFSVSAIDNVGNISEPSVIYFVLNKYVPYTTVTTINAKADDFGNLSVSIYGKGFTYDGTISTVYIDSDGKAPYDMVLTADTSGFKVNSDGRISGILITDLDEGKYRIGLVHPDRGLYFTGKILNVPETGTVKKGNYSFRYKPTWVPITEVFKYSLQMGDILLWVLFTLALVGLVISIRGITHTARDSIAVQHEIKALITGDVMPLAKKKKKSAQLKIRGIGLRFKLVFFTTFLIIMVILLVSIPLGLQMIYTQEQTLTRGLKERVDVLLEGLSAGVKAYLPTQNILELGFLPQQTDAMNEVKYATITGFPASGDNTSLDFIWATNDSSISSKIDSETLTYGASRLTGEQMESIITLCTSLNEKAVASAGEMTTDIASLTAEGIALASKTDATSVERRGEIQTITRELNEKLTSELNTLSFEGAGSWPLYNTGSLDRNQTTYIFYKPVLYRQGSEQNYVRAIIQVEVSTDNLIVSVDEARENIYRTTLVIALVAIGIGALCSLILAAVIIRPIRHLASHVAMIRDTEDKEELEGKDIKIKSKDEIGLLGETVNDMTHGLVKAAAASKDLTVGKEVQKMFIPLETDSSGKKLTTGTLDDKNVQFFGYYEGAKGVSGDYFDYKKLDDRWYAIIKCDVSGKGVPAALIMVEVATLFLNYFKDWSFKKDGTNLSPIVSQINDLIESRGFKGRFAAFTLCLFDSVSGMVYFCNAGDNLIHYYDAAEHKKKTVTLPEAAAAGVFPSFMVDMKGGFKVSSMKLNHGDVLFLYTDGIEEAKRMFRDENYKLIVCAEPGLPPEAPHGYHSVGQESEEMAPERVNAIIEAVFSKSVYRLEKYHNPIKDEVLEFDFSTCSGTAEDAIIALVSVEKIFRMYRDPSATEFDRVQVDRKIDAFLNLHFRQYDNYCSNKKDHPTAPEYMYYTNIKEDGQYDDLTLIAVKKS